MSEWVDYDWGYWNGGQRPDRDLLASWRELMVGEHTPRPLVALHVSEVADQIDVLERLKDRYGYGVVLGSPNAPDGMKEAIIFDRQALERVDSRKMVKVGDSFEGRRSGGGTMRMANKYVLFQEFRHVETGWTPTHGVTHVWPSVSLNAPHVRSMMVRVAEWAKDTPGTLCLAFDGNMPPTHALMAPMRHTDLMCTQVRYGLDPTWGKRAIDQGWVRVGEHYKTTNQITVRLPGHEGNGEVGHKALIVTGRLARR